MANVWSEIDIVDVGPDKPINETLMEAYRGSLAYLNDISNGTLDNNSSEGYVKTRVGTTSKTIYDIPFVTGSNDYIRFDKAAGAGNNTFIENKLIYIPLNADNVKVSILYSTPVDRDSLYLTFELGGNEYSTQFNDHSQSPIQWVVNTFGVSMFRGSTQPWSIWMHNHTNNMYAFVFYGWQIQLING